VKLSVPALSNRFLTNNTIEQVEAGSLTPLTDLRKV